MVMVFLDLRQYNTKLLLVHFIAALGSITTTGRNWRLSTAKLLLRGIAHTLLITRLEISRTTGGTSPKLGLHVLLA